LALDLKGFREYPYRSVVWVVDGITRVQRFNVQGSERTGVQRFKSSTLKENSVHRRSIAANISGVALLCLVCVCAIPRPVGTGSVTFAASSQGTIASLEPREDDSPLDPSPSIKAVTQFWELRSDIMGDLQSGKPSTPSDPDDNGVRKSAEELGYVNQLSKLQSGGKNGTNILLLGVDRRGERGRGRSDVIMLARITPGTGILTLSIPRDVKVPMKPGCAFGYEDKITHMYAYGGVERTMSSVENLLGIKIDHYMVVEDFSSFKRLLSLMRGVDVDKHLEGQLGLKWVRNRSFGKGDFERSMRAQLFLKAAITRAWTLTDAGDDRLVSVLYKPCLLLVKTDLTTAEILKLVDALKDSGFDPSKDIYTGHLSGRTDLSYSPVFDAKLSFIEADRRELKHLSGIFTNAKGEDRNVCAE
jgi:hypothetical protein